MQRVVTPYRLFALALLVRFAAAAAFAGRLEGAGDPAFPDVEHYLAMARHIARGEGWFVAPWALAERPPLYPLFLAFHIKVFGSAAAALATQAALGAAACVLVARIGERLWGRGAGALAGLGAAAYPFLVFASTRLLAEALLVPLVAAQMWAAVEAGRAAFAREGRRALGWAAAAGALGGLASLTHAGHLLFPLALAAAFAVAWWRARQLATPDGAWVLACGTAALFAGHVLVVAPWTIRNAHALGGFVPVTTKMGADLYEATFPGATGGTVEWWKHPAAREVVERTRGMGERERDRALRAEAWRMMREDPLRILGLAAAKFWRVWTPVPSAEGFRNAGLVALSLMTYGPVLALAFLGLLRLRRGSIVAALLLSAPAYYTLLHLVFIGSVRYRLPVEPVLVLLAAYRVAGREKT